MSMETKAPDLGTTQDTPITDLYETKTLAGMAPTIGHEPGDVSEAIQSFLGAFEDFKQANDQRLSTLEKRGSDDVVLREKIARMNDALDQQQANLDRLSLKAGRPTLAPSGAVIMDERKSAFLRYMRAGDAAALTRLEEKSLSTTTDPEGGYLAPTETENLVTRAMRDISPIRSIASVRQIGANTYRKPVSLGGTGAGWVGETALRPETTSPTLSAIDFPTMELYAMPAASQALLDDSIVDVEQWLADEVQTEFAAQEGAAFINGDGVNQPHGFLAYPLVDEGTQTHGQIGAIRTGVDGGFDPANSADTLLDLIYAPRQSYRANGTFVMNRSVVGQVRKFKDGDGNYLWQPSAQAGTPSSLLGYPVIEAEDMSDIAAGSASIAFGDFTRGYLIVDRVGLRVLRDPYSAKPYVLFYTTKRVGGGVQDFEAIKILQFSA